MTQLQMPEIKQILKADPIAKALGVVVAKVTRLEERTQSLEELAQRMAPVLRKLHRESTGVPLDLKLRSKKQKVASASKPLLNKVLKALYLVSNKVKARIYSSFDNEQHHEINATEVANAIIQFNKQDKHDDFGYFIEEHSRDPGSFAWDNEDCPKILDEFLTKLPNKPDLSSIATKELLQNIFVMFTGWKLDKKELLVDLGKADIKKLQVSLEEYFASDKTKQEPQANNELKRLLSQQDGFYQHAGKLLTLTYLSAYALAQKSEPPVAAQDALKSRFMMLYDLYNQYSFHEVEPESSSSSTEALKLVDEFLESAHINELAEYNPEAKELHELIAKDPVVICKEAIKPLIGLNTAGEALLSTEDSRIQGLNFERTYQNVLRQVLSVITLKSMTELDVQKVFDWLDDGRKEATDSREYLSRLLGLLKTGDMNDLPKHSAALAEKLPYAIALVIDDAITVGDDRESDKVIGFDETKIELLNDLSKLVKSKNSPNT